MDEKTLHQGLAETFLQDWDITPVGSGFLLVTDWCLPNRERIEIYVRTVGERDDLYLVTDGGELFNFLYAQGIDLTQDAQSMKIVNTVVDNYELMFVDYQMVKGSNAAELARSIRILLEAVKDAALLLWHKLEARGPLH